MNKVIAVDFDGCLCESQWPKIGKAHDEVIHYLRMRQARGDKIILWTCREGQLLDEAILWCLNRGLKFDAVNDNLPENKEHFGNNCRKVWADEYWDDKSVIVEQDSVCYFTSDGKRRSNCFYGKYKPNRKRGLVRKFFRELREIYEHGITDE